LRKFYKVRIFFYLNPSMYIVIHYSEIGLKGKNRAFFEKKLANNLASLLYGVKKVQRRYGRIIIEMKKKIDPAEYIRKISFIPGVSAFAFAEKINIYNVETSLEPASMRTEQTQTIDNIKKIALKILSKKNFRTFGIKTIRSNKQFSLKSSEINIIIGDLIRTKLNKKVDLGNPDATLFIEITEKEVFIYTDKYNGIGGLPVSSSGKVVALLSGGIDSPAASFLAMKRGLKIVFAHILNRSMSGNREGIAKIENIVKKLTEVQGGSQLYVVPFEEIQKTIIARIPAEFRMIVYRRFMMEIAEAVAKREGAGGIITGDSIGQVASQTLENIRCIYEGLKLPVLPPLIGMNKEEIIKVARDIGTYELSIVPYPDCCSFMIAKHPETKADIDAIKKLESLIVDKAKLVKKSVGMATVKRVTCNTKGIWEL